MRVKIRIVRVKHRWHSDWQAGVLMGDQRAIGCHHLMRIVYEKDAAGVITRPKVLATHSNVEIVIPAGDRRAVGECEAHLWGGQTGAVLSTGMPKSLSRWRVRKLTCAPKCTSYVSR